MLVFNQDPTAAGFSFIFPNLKKSGMNPHRLYQQEVK